MALFVLFSTTSFTVEKHFCGGNLIDVAIFTEAEKCSDNVEMNMSKSCCKDEVDLVEGQDELLVKTYDDVKFNTHVFLATFVYSYVNLFESLPKQIIPFKDYSPPNLIFDIQVRDQVFII